jgi:surface protein
MFYNCTSLKEVNTIGWNTAKVANFQYMFDGCTSLEHVYGIENWNVSGTVRMMNMLSNTAIRSLDLSKWSLRATVNMTNMLSGCKLQCLNLSNWDINDNATITGFIYSNDNLSNIHMYNCNTHTINKIVKMLENKVENSRVYVSSKTDMTKIESPETYWKVVPGDFIGKLSKGSINLFNGNFMGRKIKRVIIGDVDTFYYE